MEPECGGLKIWALGPYSHIRRAFVPEPPADTRIQGCSSHLHDMEQSALCILAFQVYRYGG